MAVAFRHTPVEQVEGILVKREDLCALPPMPPLAKMRGVFAYIGRLAGEGVRQVGVLDTKVSKSGQGVAIIAEHFGLACNYYFPVVKRDLEWRTPERVIAEQHGATLIPMTAGRIGIVYARAKRLETGVMLPLGFPLYDTVIETAAEVRHTLAEQPVDVLVMACGTGTILSGALLGLAQLHASGEAIPGQVYGITASMDTGKVKRRALEHLTRAAREGRTTLEDASAVLSRVRLHKEGDDYYTPYPLPPFPGHPYYEGKAWAWLKRRLDCTGRRVMFWNIGA